MNKQQISNALVTALKGQKIGWHSSNYQVGEVIKKMFAEQCQDLIGQGFSLGTEQRDYRVGVVYIRLDNYKMWGYSKCAYIMVVKYTKKKDWRGDSFFEDFEVKIFDEHGESCEEVDFASHISKKENDIKKEKEAQDKQFNDCFEMYKYLREKYPNITSYDLKYIYSHDYEFKKLLEAKPCE